MSNNFSVLLPFRSLTEWICTQRRCSATFSSGDAPPPPGSKSSSLISLPNTPAPLTAARTQTHNSQRTLNRPRIRHEHPFTDSLIATLLWKVMSHVSSTFNFRWWTCIVQVLSASSSANGIRIYYRKNVHVGSATPPSSTSTIYFAIAEELTMSRGIFHGCRSILHIVPQREQLQVIYACGALRFGRCFCGVPGGFHLMKQLNWASVRMRWMCCHSASTFQSYYWSAIFNRDGTCIVHGSYSYDGLVRIFGIR